MKSFKDISEKLKKDKDDPCWKGYVQLGTKKKNGKEVPNCVPKESNEVQEKAVSKAQQRFMGMVRAKQKGEMPDASPEVSKAAASMSKKDVKDFAKTKHKGLPAKKESVQEAKVSVGDRVTLQPNKSVLDRNLIGKAGVVTNMLDGDAMVKFTSGRTIAVSPRHLKINESVELEEASGKDIAAKMMKSKSMKAFAAKVARMPNVSAGDLEKMLPDYVPGAEIRGLFKEVTEGPDYLGDIRRKKEREERKKASPHAGETQRQKTMRKVYGNSMVFLKKGYGESVELGEANRNHPAAKKLMALAKQRDAGSDAKDYEKAAQMIMKGDAGQLGRYISRMDSYPRDAVISAVKSTDKAMYDKMMGRMESAEPMNFFEFRQALNEASKVPDGRKFIASYVYKGGDGKDHKHTHYRKGNKMTDPVVVHIDGKEWKEFSSFVKAKQAAINHIKGMKKSVAEGFMDDYKAMKAKGSNYQIYHKTYSDAVQHAVNHVFDKMGYEVDSQDFFNKVSSGPRKPSPGKTNSFSIDLFDKKTGKPVRQKLHMQVYGMDSGKYELNMYVT